MVNTSNSLSNNQTPPKATRTATITGIVSSIIINAILPFVIYILLKNYTSASDFVALVASGIPPTIAAIVDVIRKRHIDLLSGLALLAIVVSIILILLGGSPRLYLIRESFFTAALGLAYFVSLFFPRPLAFYFARYFTTGNVPAKIAWFNSLWQYKGFRHSMRVVTVVWGVGFLLEVTVRTFLVFTLTIPQFLLVSPFIFYGILAGIMLWTLLYSRQGRKRAEATRPRSIPTPEEPTPREIIT